MALNIPNLVNQGLRIGQSVVEDVIFDGELRIKSSVYDATTLAPTTSQNPTAIAIKFKISSDGYKSDSKEVKQKGVIMYDVYTDGAALEAYDPSSLVLHFDNEDYDINAITKKLVGIYKIEVRE